MKQKKWIYIGFIILQGIIYGIHDPLAKLVYREVPVYFFLAARYILGCLIFLILFRKRLMEDWKKASISSLLLPSLCLSLAYVCVNQALGKTDATLVVFLRSLGALFTAMLSFGINRKLPRGKDYALGLLLLAGLWFLFCSGGTYVINAGVFLALAGALLVAGALVFGEEAVKSASPLVLSFLQTVASAVICMVCAACKHEIHRDTFVRMAKPEYILILIYAAAAVGCLGFLLQNIALAHIPSRLVGVLQCSYPLTTMIVAPFLLGEVLAGSRLFGATLILVCIVLNALDQGESCDTIQVSNTQEIG